MCRIILNTQQSYLFFPRLAKRAELVLCLVNVIRAFAAPSLARSVSFFSFSEMCLTLEKEKPVPYVRVPIYLHSVALRTIST